MKKFLFLAVLFSLFSCKEHYSDGERVGTVTKFSQSGVFWDSWDGLLNVTQTGMNSSGEPFPFSLDNDREDQQHLVKTLIQAQAEGWKVKIKYHKVWGLKNFFNNRGESDYFIDEITVLDRHFSQSREVRGERRVGQVVDTIWVVVDKQALLQK